MSVASVDSILDRFNALYDYEVLHMSKTQIAKRYGVCTSMVDGWVQRRNYFLNRVKDIIKKAAVREGKKVQVFFNNHPNGSGAKNGQKLKEMISD